MKTWQKKACYRFELATAVISTLLEEMAKVRFETDAEELATNEVYFGLINYVVGAAHNPLLHSPTELRELVEDARKGTRFHRGVLTVRGDEAIERFIDEGFNRA